MKWLNYGLRTYHDLFRGAPVSRYVHISFRGTRGVKESALINKTLTNASVQRSQWSEGRRAARMQVAIVLVVAIFVRADLQAAETDRDDVAYRFEESLEGWAPASSSEMHLDVAARGGNLVGTIVGEAPSDPHLDSPLLVLNSAERQTVVIRMKYQSGGLRGARLVAQYGARAVSNPAASGPIDWTARRPPVPITASGIPSDSPINDGNDGTVWKGAVGEGVTFAFWSAGELAVGQDTSTGHAVTDLEIRCVVGFCPMSLDLRVGTTNKTLFSATILNDDDLQYFSTSLSSNERHHYWRVVFLSSYGGRDVRIRELRLLPAVVEAHFGISPNPDYQSYIIPIWRKAATAKLGGDERTSYNSPLQLARLRIYFGDVVLAPGENRNYDASANPACVDWQKNEQAGFGEIAWAALFWRLRLVHERVGPWVVSELAMQTSCVRKFVDLQR